MACCRCCAASLWIATQTACLGQQRLFQACRRWTRRPRRLLRCCRLCAAAPCCCWASPPSAATQARAPCLGCSTSGFCRTAERQPASTAAERGEQGGKQGCQLQGAASGCHHGWGGRAWKAVDESQGGRISACRQCWRVGKPQARPGLPPRSLGQEGRHLTTHQQQAGRQAGRQNSSTYCRAAGGLNSSIYRRRQAHSWLTPHERCDQQQGQALQPPQGRQLEDARPGGGLQGRQHRLLGGLLAQGCHLVGGRPSQRACWRRRLRPLEQRPHAPLTVGLVGVLQGAGGCFRVSRGAAGAQPFCRNCTNAEHGQQIRAAAVAAATRWAGGGKWASPRQRHAGCSGHLQPLSWLAPAPRRSLLGSTPLESLLLFRSCAMLQPSRPALLALLSCVLLAGTATADWCASARSPGRCRAAAAARSPPLPLLSRMLSS